MAKKIELYRTSDRNIIIIETIITALLLASILWSTLHIHIAICISISIVLAILIFSFFSTKVGFWIITIFFSLIWATMGGDIAYSISKNDNIWGIVVGIFVFIISLGLHLTAKRYQDNVKEY